MKRYDSYVAVTHFVKYNCTWYNFIVSNMKHHSLFSIDAKCISIQCLQHFQCEILSCSCQPSNVNRVLVNPQVQSFSLETISVRAMYIMLLTSLDNANSSIFVHAAQYI